MNLKEYFDPDQTPKIYFLSASSPLIPTRMKEALKEVEKTKDGLYVPRMANGKPGLPEYVSK